MELSEELWSELVPGDSYDVRSLEDVVEVATNYGKSEGEVWRLIEVFRGGGTLEAPVVIWDWSDNNVEVGSGNTRLMISRVLGIRPVVWLVEVEPRTKAGSRTVDYSGMAGLGDFFQLDRDGNLIF